MEDDKAIPSKDVFCMQNNLNFTVIAGNNWFNRLKVNKLLTFIY